MPTVLLQLPGGAGVVRRDDDQILVTWDISDDRGQLLGGRADFRPVQTWFDEARSIVAGRMPRDAVSAEIIDERGARIAATTGGGVYAAIVEQPHDGHQPVVCCRDQSGSPVPRPLPADWTRTEVTDADEPCPACGAIAYDEVLPTDGSRGGRGGHSHDGPLEPCRIVVCRCCGHEEGAGSMLVRFTAPDDEDETARAARIARRRAEMRVRKWYADAMTLRCISFPIYAAETWAARITGSASGGPVRPGGDSSDDVTEITIGHSTGPTDDPFVVPDLTVTTAIAAAREDPLHQARHALEISIHSEDDPPGPEGLSDAATKLWSAARRRERRAAVLGAMQTEQAITIDGTSQPFLKLSTPSGAWVAVRHHDELIVTITACGIDPATLTLEPIAAPAARLLGPEPKEPPDDST